MGAYPCWLVVTFTPGFSPVRHRCIVEVTYSGQLRQRLTERRAGEWITIVPNYETQLDGAQLEILQAAVTRIDFERLASRLTPARDACRLTIEWHRLDGPFKRVEGRILDYGRGYHDFAQTFEPAQQLWRLIYELLPRRFLERA